MIPLLGSLTYIQRSVRLFSSGISAFEVIVFHIEAYFHFTYNIPTFQRSNRSGKRHRIRNSVLHIMRLFQITVFGIVIIFRLYRKMGRRIRKAASDSSIKNGLVSHRTLQYIQRKVIIEIKLQPFIGSDLKLRVYIVLTQVIVHLIQ